MMYSTINLITQTPSAHGKFDTITETTRKVYCEVRSVSRSEYYLAKSAGLNPEYLFYLSDYAEYQGEKSLTYGGVRYRIVRTYCTGAGIELTAEREAVE